MFRYYGPEEMPSKVKMLEEEYAGYTGRRHALALNSCTSALISALVAIGIEPGDEVIVPAYTFFATVAAVVAAKAVPVIAEVDKSLTLDIQDVERKVTSRTKAIAVVHMRGMPAKMDGIVGRMQNNKRRIKERIRGIRGLDFREVTDEEGDVAVCLVIYLPDKEKAREFSVSLQAEGVEAGAIYDSGVPDWHIYAHWKMLMEKMMPLKKGCPFNCPLSPNGKEIEYTEGMCPNTLDWLGRSIHLDIPPQLTDEDCDQIAAAIQKVASVLL